MANDEHIAVIRLGAAALDAWGREHPDVRLLLDWASLRQVELPGADLRGADCFGANLFQANLSGTTLRFADLRLANITVANLSGADLSGASLTETILHGTDLSGANLSGANLSGADLSKTNLSGANLGQADLATADLSGANLSGANLNGAELGGANFSQTELNRADFNEARVGWTKFTTVNLATARGLETVHHRGPSSIGIDTLYLSVGKIPDVFLRRAGVQDTYITFAHSLVNKPIDFYSCFISYSSPDQEFAERLFADLQASGVRCWFAPEDQQISEPFRGEMERSVRAYDKLVLVLSNHSIHGGWVETFVETALERERRLETQTRPGNGPTAILFPIRLDDSAVQTEHGWARDIRRTRQIGDFTQWKDHDAYTLAFRHLLHALTTGASDSPATTP